MEKPEITVVIPVYRNGPFLKRLHGELRRILGEEGWRYEVIFVNDACPADSLDVLKDIAAQHEHVTVLDLRRNIGQQRAVRLGLAYVRGDAAVIMDGDLQDPPAAIPQLMTKLGEGYAAVFAGRRGRYESVPRLITSRLFKRTLHLLAGVPPDAGIFVALDRRMIDFILSFDTVQPNVVAIVGCSRLPLYSVPVVRGRRPEGESAYNFSKRLRAGLQAFWLVIGWHLKRRRRKRETLQEEQLVRCIGARFGNVEKGDDV